MGTGGAKFKDEQARTNGKIGFAFGHSGPAGIV
jgi:hypothetical protein